MLLKIKISGEVQGVGFRFSVLGKAKELWLKGFVRNEPDGSVFIEATGERENLERLLRWCEKEAPGKILKTKHEFFNEFEKYNGFDVK